MYITKPDVCILTFLFNLPTFVELVIVLHQKANVEAPVFGGHKILAKKMVYDNHNAPHLCHTFLVQLSYFDH